MAVVKANGYGHGIVNVTRALEAAGATHFMVGKLEEACQLRSAGVRAQILNFGPYESSDAEDIVRLDISQNVYTNNVEALERAARRLRRPAKVHIKIDTGLGRVGVPYEQSSSFIGRTASLPHISIEGVFTTFTEDHEFDMIQLERFLEVCDRAREQGFPIGLRHAASSASILDLPDSYKKLDMVRPGIMLYGLYPSTSAEELHSIDLRPVLSLKTRIVCINNLRPGESVSYHRAFIATQPELIATLPVGYSDGLPKALVGKGHVLISGRSCSILAILSNATMVRMADVPASIGDEATLLGKRGGFGVPVSEVAKMLGTSVYSTVMQLSPALPKVSVDG